MSSIFTHQQSLRTPEHLNQLTQTSYHQIYPLVEACPLKMCPHNINVQSCQDSTHKKQQLITEITNYLCLVEGKSRAQLYCSF